MFCLSETQGQTAISMIPVVFNSQTAIHWSMFTVLLLLALPLLTGPEGRSRSRSKAAGDGRADLPLFCIITPLNIWVQFYSTCKSFLGPGPWDGWQCGNGDFQESPSLEYYSLLQPLDLNFEGMFFISFYCLKGGTGTIQVVQELPVKMLRIQWLSPKLKK